MTVRLRNFRLPSRQSTNDGNTTTSTTRIDHKSPRVTEVPYYNERRGSVVMEKPPKDKRHSLVGALVGRSSSPSTTGKSSPRNSPKVGPTKPATLTIDMESPPSIFYGTPEQSSGALISGQIILNVTDPSEIHLTTFEMILSAISTTRKPVVEKCPNCISRENSLHKWKFLTAPDSRFSKGIHKFPFSYLVPGHLPITIHNILGNIDYLLSASATTSLSETLNITRPLRIQRALMPGIDKNSIRVFPPTSLTAYVQLPSVIHPIGEFPLQMRMTGITVRHGKDNTNTTYTRWRLRKCTWRLEETIKNISAACTKHASKIGGEGKGVYHEEIRELGVGELKSGWKTDFDTGQDGEIELEFPFSFNKSPLPHPPSSDGPQKDKDKDHFPPSCDFESPTGFSSQHTLSLELVIAEERVPSKPSTHSRSAIPTGSARVLRMQFKVVVTERAGMGISWDEEMPPMYEDVPTSPPGYVKVEEYEGDDLGGWELDGEDSGSRERERRG